MWRISKNILFILPVPHFFSQAAGVGGHVAHANGIVNGFSKLGYELDIIAEEAHPTIENDQTRLHIRPIGKYSFLKRQTWSWRLIRHAKKMVAKRRPLFCYVRYSVGFTPFIPVLKRMIGSIPLVLEVNSFGAQYYSWLKLTDLQVLKSADIIICVSETLRKLILAKVNQKLDAKILVLPNGVDIDKYSNAVPNYSFIKKKKNINLGYGGILKPDYGFDVLLDGYSLVRESQNNVSLHFFGDGPYYKELKIKTDSMDGVELHGAITLEKMPAVLKSLDVLCHTTVNENAFQSPIKLYEYMATGKPIVAAETLQIRELLGNNERGLLYPIGDSKMLCKQILRLIDNIELGQKLAGKAFSEVKANHSWQRRILILLNELKRRGLIAS